MSTQNTDALLVTAKGATAISRIVIVVGMIGLGIAGAATFFSGALDAGSLAAGRHTQIEIAFVAGVVLALCSLGLAYEFVSRLATVIDTVGEGDPFTSANADELTRMGWLALAIQVIGIPALLLSEWLDPYLAAGTMRVNSDVSLTGIGLALVLFVLARVFRKGTEMREDLEGTV